MDMFSDRSSILLTSTNFKKNRIGMRFFLVLNRLYTFFTRFILYYQEFLRHVPLPEGTNEHIFSKLFQHLNALNALQFLEY